MKHAGKHACHMIRLLDKLETATRKNHIQQAEIAELKDNVALITSQKDELQKQLDIITKKATRSRLRSQD